MLFIYGLFESRGPWKNLNIGTRHSDEIPNWEIAVLGNYASF